MKKNILKKIILIFLMIYSQNLIALENKPEIIVDPFDFKQILSNLNISRITLPTQNYNFFPQTILMILDFTETNSNKIISQELLQAIQQEACPIITTINLLNNVKPNFVNSNNWLIKTTFDKLLYLLIPHKSLDNLKISLQEAEKVNYLVYGSPIELKLGLLVNQFKTIKIEDLSPTPNALLNPFFYAYISAFFCSKSIYIKNLVINLPVWSIYYTGHGDQDNIGILNYDNFKNLLNFFEERINTKLFIYSSCFSAGQNIEKTYKETNSSIQKNYSFPIISFASTDEVVYGNQADFSNFVKEVTSSEILDYEKIINFINPYPYNYPLIKLPGIEWFNPIEDKNKIVQIGSILTKARIEPFYVPESTKILLLYSNHIPFDLIIDKTDTNFRIISMLPGESVTKIQKIIIPVPKSNTILDFIDWFTVKDQPSYDKIFLIKNINNFQDILICNYSRYNSNTKKRVIFLKNYLGKTFKYEKANTLEFATPEEILEYQKLLQEAETKYLELQKKTWGLLPSNIGQEEISSLNKIVQDQHKNNQIRTSIIKNTELVRKGENIQDAVKVALRNLHNENIFIKIALLDLLIELVQNDKFIELALVYAQKNLDHNNFEIKTKSLILTNLILIKKAIYSVKKSENIQDAVKVALRNLHNENIIVKIALLDLLIELVQKNKFKELALVYAQKNLHNINDNIKNKSKKLLELVKN